MSSITSVGPRTLADVIPGGLVRDVALVAGGAILVGLSALVVIPLPFTPIPLSLQTLAVLLVGSALGSVRGLISMALYLVVGMAGFGWFAQGRSGWEFASFGYILGFLLAAALVGKLAERGARPQSPLKTAGAMALGNLAIYAVGVPWLMAYAKISLLQALALGVLPFLIGDAIKIIVAAGLLPATWKLVNPAAMTRFSAEIIDGGGGGHAVVVPAEIAAELSKKRARVLALVNGTEYHSRIARYGGKSYLGLRKDLLRSIGADTGDVVEVELTEEPEPESEPDAGADRTGGADGRPGRRSGRASGLRRPAAESPAGVRPLDRRGGEVRDPRSRTCSEDRGRLVGRADAEQRSISPAGGPAARSRPPRSAQDGSSTGRRPSPGPVRPKVIAWISGWMSVEACGPTRWAPSSRPSPGSASTLTKWLMSSMAQPYATDP